MNAKINIAGAIEYCWQQTGYRLTQRELAERMWPDKEPGTREMTMSNINRGKVKRIAIDDLHKIKAITGCPWGVLLGE